MQKLKVFVTRPNFPPAGIQILKDKFEVECYSQPHAIPIDDLLQGIRGKDALYCISTDRIDKEVLDTAGPQLKVISTVSLGYEHIDIEECKKRNIVVCNGPNPLSAGSVAEITIALMLSIGRKLMNASQAIKNGEWIQTWSPDWFVGRGLMNTVVGIVGMGRIGQALLKRVLPFDVKEVFYYDVVHPVLQAEELGAKFSSLDDLLRNSDFVISTCNLTSQSRGMFDKRAFSLMKPSAVFVNTSRGAVVEQEALYEALKNGTIKAAGLDVMYPEPLPKDHKLVSLPNVVLLPHIAGAEEIALNRLATLAAENIAAVLLGEPPITRVF